MTGATSNATVGVTGLRETIRNLQKLGVEVQDLKDVMRSAGDIVKDEAQRTVPVRTGALRETLRTGAAKDRVRVMAGRAKVPYAKYAENGPPAPASRFMLKASRSKADDVVHTVDKGIARLIRLTELA